MQHNRQEAIMSDTEEDEIFFEGYDDGYRHGYMSGVLIGMVAAAVFSTLLVLML